MSTSEQEGAGPMSDNAVWKDDHWEVNPDVRGEHIPTPYQRMDHAERRRIIKQRLRYLDYMHDHFADKLIQPPEGVEEVESTHGHH